MQILRVMFALCLVMIISFSAAEGAVKGEPVSYSANGITLNGYLAYDPAIQGKRPGIMVVHEWWGHDAYARKRAEMLAELGYTALAVDMYGEGKQAAHPADAGQFSSAVMKNFETGTARFNAALELIRNHPTVDPTRIAAIGYCFGGGIVLNMARQGADLKGVASFHGSLAAVKPAEPGGGKAKILVLHGADDSFTKPEQIDAFKDEMKKAGADMRFISYAGAKHSFTNPAADEYAQKFSMPGLAYNARVDRESWREMICFFQKIFR